MNESSYRPDSAAEGHGSVRLDHGPHASFTYYCADRPAHTKRMRAAEAVLDIAINIPQPLHLVWPVFKDFNVWMNRFGYFWDQAPAENEHGYVYLSGERPAPSKPEYGVKYIVRKVIPQRLIYFDSMPAPIDGNQGVWSGHNVMSLDEEAEGLTRVSIFMEHTWYSETISIEELRAVGKQSLEAAIAFWRDFFVVDLIAALESTQKQRTRRLGEV